MPKIVRLLVATVAVMLLLPACSRRETDVDRATREQVLLIGVDADVSELDPQVVTGIADFNILLALFEGLVDLDPRTLAPVPALAESWETSPDGLTLTFHLRPDLKWSNGVPLTVNDVIASWRRLLSPSLGAEYATLLYPVVNAEAYHRGQLDSFGPVGISATGPTTLQLRLVHPAPHLVEAMALPPLFPVPVQTILFSGPIDRRGNPWTRPATFVGNGPFRLQEWRPGQLVAAEKNPHYRAAAQVRLNAVKFFTVENLDTEERMFRSGQLHVVSALPVTRVAAWQQDHAAVLRRVPFFGTDFFRLNVTRPGLDDPRVRRALALAIDREVLVRRALNGTKQPAAAFVPPGLWSGPPAGVLRTDAAAARDLLAAAGHPGGHGLPPLTILFNSSAQHRAVAEVVQEMWRRELGVEVQLENQEKKVVHEAQRTGQFQVLRSSWTADYADPATFLALCTSHDGNNATGWSNAAYDRLVDEAAATADPAAREALLQQAEALLLEQAPIIPLYHYVNYYLVHPAVRGWEGNALDRRPLRALWLEP